MIAGDFGQKCYLDCLVSEAVAGYSDQECGW